MSICRSTIASVDDNYIAAFSIVKPEPVNLLLIWYFTHIFDKKHSNINISIQILIDDSIILQTLLRSMSFNAQEWINLDQNIS